MLCFYQNMCMAHGWHKDYYYSCLAVSARAAAKQQIRAEVIRGRTKEKSLSEGLQQVTSPLLLSGFNPRQMKLSPLSSFTLL